MVLIDLILTGLWWAFVYVILPIIVVSIFDRPTVPNSPRKVKPVKKAKDGTDPDDKSQY